MFGNQDAYERQVKPVAVKLELTNGTELIGEIDAHFERGLRGTLNGDEPFVLLRSAEGEPAYIAKACISSVKPFAMEAADQLSKATNSSATLDPHVVLGVVRGASLATVTGAYHQIVKTYHPDRFAGMNLPEEMLLYADALLKRANLAFAELKKRTDDQNAA